MIAGEVLAKLRPWLLPIGAAIIVLLLIAAWNRASRRGEEVDRAREQLKLERAGLVVEVETKSRDLEAAARESQDLRTQLEAAKKAAPGIRVVEVVRWKTKPGVAGGAPREQAPAEGAAAPPVQPSSGGPAGVGCLLMPGDTGEVRVSEAQLEGRAGSKVFIAAAEAWRLTPTETRLFGGSIWTPVPGQEEEGRPVALVERQAPLPRWGAGLAAYGGPQGWAAGPALAFPPLRVWGFQGELVAGAGAGPSGTWQGGVTAIVRR